jgi:hypothetical protein
MGSSASRMMVRKSRQSRGHEPVQGSGSQPESALGLMAVHHKIVGLVEPQNQDRCLDRQGRDPGTSKSFETGDTQRDHGACVGRTRTATKAWPPDENIQVLTIFPLRGMYLLLSCRGSMVICPTRRDFIYIYIYIYI